MDGNKDHRNEDTINNLFKGLNKFVDILSDMVETGKNLQQYSGELGDEKENGLRGHYGFSIKLGDSSSENIEQFREIVNNKTKTSKESMKVVEPQVDIYDENDCIIFAVELPGISEEDVKIAVGDSAISISAENKYKRYFKKIPLKFNAKNIGYEKVLNNGILKITIRKNGHQE